MDIKRVFECAVVLVPALVSFALMIGVVVLPALASWLTAFLQEKHKVHWASEVLAHAAFYGSAIAGFSGVGRESGWSLVIATLWFFVLLVGSYWLANLAAVETSVSEEDLDA
jgi:hypothetical protein